MQESRGAGGFDATAITRPSPVLLKYYVIVALLTGPLFPITFLPLFFRYETLRYKFDSSGIFMAWGLLFRREISLTYRRIQDIHLSRGLLQRWLGLATVSVQTASGSAGPEMNIEGILEAEGLRDFLYSRMRGAKGDGGGEAERPEHPDEALALLHEIRDLVRQMADRGSVER